MFTFIWQFELWLTMLLCNKDSIGERGEGVKMFLIKTDWKSMPRHITQFIAKARRISSYSLYYFLSFLKRENEKRTKWKCCHGYHFCHNLQKITEKLCWTFMRELWKYDKKLPSCFHVRNNHRQILKRKPVAMTITFATFLWKKI